MDSSPRGMRNYGERIATLKVHEGTIDLHWIVKGHSVIKGKEEEDGLAALGRRKQVEDVIDLFTPKELTVLGMALENGSQREFYKSVMAVKRRTPATEEKLERRKNKTNMTLTQTAA